MSPRAGIVLGVAVITGGIAWFGCGSKTEPSSKRAPEGSAAGTEPGSSTVKSRDGKIDLTPATRPTAAPAPVPATPDTNTAFESQERDAAWAGNTESEIRHRFDTGVRAGHLDSTQCRSDQCLLTMSGTQDEMSKAISDLETEGGLRDFADHIVLSGPEQQGDKLVVRVYAVFDRKTER